MEKIDTPFLVSMLYTAPTNDFQSGFNSALITLLKSQTDEAEPEIDLALKSVFNHLHKNGTISFNPYKSISRQDKDTIYGELKCERKLSSVKLMKEFSGLGLKESKDVIDLFLLNYVITPHF